MKEKIRFIQVCHLMLFASLMASCKQNQAQQETHGYYFHQDTVFVEKDNPLLSNLSIVVVNEELFSMQIEAVGKIAADPTLLAYINMPFSGRAVKSYVHFGQKVEAGTALFEIVSSEFIAAQKGFFQAQSERELALKDFAP